MLPRSCWKSFPHAGQVSVASLPAQKVQIDDVYGSELVVVGSESCVSHEEREGVEIEREIALESEEE